MQLFICKFVFIHLGKLKIYLHMKTLTPKEAAIENKSTSYHRLFNAKYEELEIILGAPTYDAKDGMDKSNFLWLIKFKGKIFSIYDWKSTAIYSITERSTWHLGTEWQNPDYNINGEFVEELQLRLKTLRESNENIYNKTHFIKPKY